MNVAQLRGYGGPCLAASGRRRKALLRQTVGVTKISGEGPGRQVLETHTVHLGPELSDRASYAMPPSIWASGQPL